MIINKSNKKLTSKKITECPVCKNKNIKIKDYFPFCSKYCCEVDLSR